MLNIRSSTPLSELSRAGMSLIDSLHESGFAKSELEKELARSLMADRSAGTTIADLAKSLRGSKASSLGDVYCHFAEFFKVCVPSLQLTPAASSHVSLLSPCDRSSRAGHSISSPRATASTRAKSSRTFGRLY